MGLSPTTIGALVGATTTFGAGYALTNGGANTGLGSAVAAVALPLASLVAADMVHAPGLAKGLHSASMGIMAGEMGVMALAMRGSSMNMPMPATTPTSEPMAPTSTKRTSPMETMNPSGDAQMGATMGKDRGSDMASMP